ncbi:hypothetical protein EPN83_02865 [Patescibacteria group bacterium]|nr:MAG: hypothetical protein EPN83_02865 [Patescibacteria group bacterium]
MRFFEELDLTDLKDSIVLLDLDGTLVPDGQSDISERAMRKVEELKRANEVYLCSNSRNVERRMKVGRQTGLAFTVEGIQKPSEKVVSFLGNISKPIVVIGDKAIIDGRLSRNLGAKFIKVRRKRSEKDSLFTRLVYWLDDFYYNIFSHI